MKASLSKNKGACSLGFHDLINHLLITVIIVYNPFSFWVKFVCHIKVCSKKKNSSFIKMAGSIANVMLTPNDEVDSLSDLTQICLEIKSQVSAIYRFICPKRPNCLKNLKIYSRCLIIALCERDF